MKLTDQKLISLNELVSMVSIENGRQLDKWGIQTRTPFEWMTYITEEVGELAKAVSEEYYRDGKLNHIIDEAIQLATLSLKLAEMYKYGRTPDRGAVATTVPEIHGDYSKTLQRPFR